MQESDGISLTGCEGQQPTKTESYLHSSTQVMGIMVNNSYMSKFPNLTVDNVSDCKIQMTFMSC